MGLNPVEAVLAHSFRNEFKMMRKPGAGVRPHGA